MPGCCESDIPRNRFKEVCDEISDNILVFFNETESEIHSGYDTLMNLTMDLASEDEITYPLGLLRSTAELDLESFAFSIRT